MAASPRARPGTIQKTEFAVATRSSVVTATANAEADDGAPRAKATPVSHNMTYMTRRGNPDAVQAKSALWAYEPVGPDGVTCTSKRPNREYSRTTWTVLSIIYATPARGELVALPDSWAARDLGSGVLYGVFVRMRTSNESIRSMVVNSLPPLRKRSPSLGSRIIRGIHAGQCTLPIPS